MSMTDRLLNGLNPQQQKAVQTTNGPLLLMAGAPKYEYWNQYDA